MEMLPCPASSRSRQAPHAPGAFVNLPPLSCGALKTSSALAAEEGGGGGGQVLLQP